MQTQLVSTQTDDGLRLDGALFAAVEAAAGDEPPSRPDLFICLHGAGANFYASSTLRGLVEPLTKSGAAMLLANTRGRDGVFTAHTASGPRRLGAATEIVADCRRDIAAWLDCAGQLGYRRVGLLGHSLGAIKALYYAAQERAMPELKAALPNAEPALPDEKPAVPHEEPALPHEEPALPHEEPALPVVAISPPLLSYRAFLTGERATEFRGLIHEAQERVAAGRGQDLLESTFPMPLLISAATYIDKYGPQENYNILHLAERAACPALFIYGQLELEGGGIAFAGLDKKIAALSGGGPRRVVTVPSANHVYTGQIEPLAAKIVAWLETGAAGAE